MGWYAAVVCEVISGLHVIGEDFTAFILPYVMYGMKPHVVTEYRDATYMILAQLCSKVTLKQEILTGMYDGVLA